MRLKDIQELLHRGLINSAQHNFLESVFSAKKISVYYELRIMLYLGVMLLTTGLGILIYENIGEVGHIILITVLFSVTAACFAYAFRNGKSFSFTKVEHNSPYFDYIVLLGCLLFISALGYLQFQYAIFDESMGLATLITATWFFYIAYRFDHLGVLSLGISALASFWSLSISPQKWYSADFLDEANLHVTAVMFGGTLCVVALIIDRLKIKQHFTFTYINMSALIYLCGAVAGIFIQEDYYGYFVVAVFLGCGFCIYFANTRKSFLFLLYAFAAGYIAITYLLADMMLYDIFSWFLYFLVSCGGLIFFIVRYKTYFKRAE